ncbi:MAG: adenine phosphoribosyltransferase [Clostridia bacterium]|nr:adenine phosphoribosyltransferase [Clostridia bacterium]
MKKDIKEYIRTIPDFPEKGIMFRDITSVLNDADGLRLAIDLMEEKAKKYDFDLIVGPESRGFIFGVPIAYNLYKPFAPVRKKGKLPSETVSVEYDLEYGTAVLEMHKDAIKKGQKVLIVDDLMATGGTIEAITKLVESLGGEVVAGIFLIELKGLKGREKFKNFPVETIISYEGK